MAETKMTQKDMYMMIAETMADNAEVVAFCEKKITQLSKPRNSKEKPEVAEFRAAVATYLSEQEEPVTNKAIAEALEASSQKVAAALKKLVAEDTVIRIEDGKTATFVIA